MRIHIENLGKKHSEYLELLLTLLTKYLKKNPHHAGGQVTVKDGKTSFTGSLIQVGVSYSFTIESAEVPTGNGKVADQGGGSGKNSDGKLAPVQQDLLNLGVKAVGIGSFEYQGKKYRGYAALAQASPDIKSVLKSHGKPTEKKAKK